MDVTRANLIMSDQTCGFVSGDTVKDGLRAQYVSLSLSVKVFKRGMRDTRIPQQDSGSDSDGALNSGLMEKQL